MRHRLILASVIVTMAVVPVPAAASAPPEQPFEMRVNAANGTGCKPGTYEVRRLPDNDGIQVVYSDFRARAGTGTLPTDFRKNCQVSVQIRPPGGYTYAVHETESVGTADIARGASGLHRGNHYYAGGIPMPFVNHSFPSGFADSWQAVDTIDAGALFWVWCDMAASLNSNVEARVAKGTANPETVSFVAVESVTYRFVWRRCATGQSVNPASPTIWPS